jgi:ubiquinol-cytochrome c reductase iron-sulfur subunit
LCLPRCAFFISSLLRCNAASGLSRETFEPEKAFYRRRRRRLSRASETIRNSRSAHNVVIKIMRQVPFPRNTTLQEPKRRDFLYVAAGTIDSVGIATSAWPFIDQMQPSAAVLAAGVPLSVDLSPLMPGQQIIVIWRSRPIFIVHRTEAILDRLKQRSLADLLRDPNSNEFQQPTYARNWSRSIKPEYLVVVAVCTHLGCVPTFTPNPGTIGPSWPGGYLCHCHGSKYDLAGRVFKGVPAPYNLPVPPYSFSSSRTLLIGQNPPGESFSLSSIEQI